MRYGHGKHRPVGLLGEDLHAVRQTPVLSFAEDIFQSSQIAEDVPAIVLAGRQVHPGVQVGVLQVVRRLRLKGAPGLPRNVASWLGPSVFAGIAGNARERVIEY
jgi:hypothetical protein